MKWLPALLLSFLMAALVSVGVRADRPAAAEASSGLEDRAGCFTAAAIRQARDGIRDVKERYGKDLLIETFLTVHGDRADEVRSMGAAERARFFSAWGAERARLRGVDGIHVLVCRNPGRVQVTVGDETARQAFPVADRDELVRVMLARFRDRDDDRGLLEGVEFVRRRLDSHRPAREDLEPGPRAVSLDGETNPPAHQPDPMLVLDADGHWAAVKKVLFTPDGSRLITVADDKTIRVWSVAGGECLQVLHPPIGVGPWGMLYAAALSPDGQTLAVGGLGTRAGDYPIYLVSLAAGRIDRVLRGHHSAINALAFSPDGKYLASGSNDRTGRLWAPGTGECLQTLQGHTKEVYDIAFAPDGRRLATASFDLSSRVWSVATGRCETVLAGHDQEVHCVAWSPDGRTIATGSHDQSIRVWDPDGTRRSWFQNLGGEIVALDFSRDSSRLLYTCGGAGARETKAALLDLATGKEVVRFGHSNTVMAGVLSPDGLLAASTGGDNNPVYLWRVADGQMVHRLAGSGRNIYAAAWSQGDRGIAWGHDRRKGDLWKADVPLDRAFRVSDLAFDRIPNPESARRAQLSLGEVRLERISTTTVAVHREGTRAELKLGQEHDIVRSASLLGRDRAVVGSDFDLALFDTRTAKVIRHLLGPKGMVTALAPSSDGRYILASSNDQTLRIWAADAPKTGPLLSLFFAGTEWIAWTTKGYYAASPGGERLMGWQVNNGPDQMASFYPASQFRKTLYRPDVIARLLDAGSLEKALEEADRERGGKTVETEAAEVLPPQVVLTSPRPGQRLAGKTVEVEAVAESRSGGPVTALQLLLDGRPYRDNRVRKVVREPRPGKAAASWLIELPPGTHRLAVKAFCRSSDALSDEVAVHCDPPGESEPHGTGPALRVLAIGINAYPGRLKLDAAAPDARAIEQAFRRYSGRLFRSVETRLLTDRQATRQGILDGLDWLQARARHGDVSVVFYAGHGDCQLAGQFYLLPADVNVRDLPGTAVSGEALRARLGSLPSSTLLLLDACYSGSFDDRKKRRSLPGPADGLMRELVYDEGLVVLCGALKDQEAIEASGHGYFTRALVDGLAGGARGRDGLVTTLRLGAYVVDKVRDLSGGAQEANLGQPTTVRSFALSKP